MSGITVQLKGLDEVLKKLDVKKFERDITDELIDFGNNVVRDAKQNVEDNGTTDRGDLVNKIGSESTKPLTVTIFVNIFYAAFIEFGTRKFAAAYVSRLPADWQAFAAQYKGSGGGGTFAEFIIKITEWVKRKGFAAELTKSGNISKSKSSEAAQDQAAYLIAMSILRNGIKAQPYLYPAFEKNVPLLIERLKKLLNA